MYECTAQVDVVVLNLDAETSWAERRDSFMTAPQFARYRVTETKAGYLGTVWRFELPQGHSLTDSELRAVVPDKRKARKVRKALDAIFAGSPYVKFEVGAAKKNKNKADPFRQKVIKPKAKPAIKQGGAMDAALAESKRRRMSKKERLAVLGTKANTHDMCSRCKAVLPFSAFYKNKSTATGRYGNCKLCFSAAKRKHNDTA